MSRSYGFGIFVGDTDKRDILPQVLQVPDPFDLESYVLTKIEWEKILILQAANQSYKISSGKRISRIAPPPVTRPVLEKKPRVTSLETWQARMAENTTVVAIGKRAPVLGVACVACGDMGPKRAMKAVPVFMLCFECGRVFSQSQGVPP